jgi:DNA-binding GntR family transcriptional regulator
MKALETAPKRVEQVYDAILAEVADGRLPPGERIIQEQIAQELGVSRQPVQQALLLLRKQGVLHDAPGRGLIVAPIDPDHLQQMYEVRGVMEGLAARKAAERNAARARREGSALIDAGRRAVRAGSIAGLIAADMAFHDFVYELSGNRLIAPAMRAHWVDVQRAMGEAFVRDQQPRDIWDQHEAILRLIAAGDGAAAEAAAREHIERAAQYTVARLRGEAGAPAAEPAAAHA